MLRLVCAVFLVLVPFLPLSGHAADVHAISLDEDNGYGAAVLEKVMKKWSPPRVRGSHTVLVKVSLDGQGRLLSCVPLKRSSLDAFDQVACSAVRSQAPFGRTSYEAPLDLYLTFRVGGDEAQVNRERSQEEILRAQIIEKNQAEHARAKATADAAEQRARAKALDAAKQKGQDLPEIRPAPVAPKHAQAPATASPQNKGEKPQLERASPQRNANGPSYGEQPGGPTTLPTQASDRVQKYTNLLSRYLTRIVHLPKKVPEGRYAAKVQVVLEPSGRIARASVLESSGNSDADAAIVKSVLVSKTVPAPPKSLGLTFAVPIVAIHSAP